MEKLWFPRGHDDQSVCSNLRALRSNSADLALCRTVPSNTNNHMSNPRNSCRLTNCLVRWQRNLEVPAKFAFPEEDAASPLEDLPFLELLERVIVFLSTFLATFLSFLSVKDLVVWVLIFCEIALAFLLRPWSKARSLTLFATTSFSFFLAWTFCGTPFVWCIHLSHLRPKTRPRCKG